MAMRRQTDLALKYDRPIVIHSRNSIDDCIDIVIEKQNGSLKGVFHCFSGTLEQAKKIIDAGFYLGIGGVLTFKNAGLDKVVQELTLDNLVLETDAPYLAPVPYRGKRNEPAFVSIVAEKLAALKNMSMEDVAGITTANAKKVLQLVCELYFCRPNWRLVRVVEGARLESVYTSKGYRGFESLSLRCKQYQRN